MDFVNQAIAQVSDLFRSMTPGARVTAGLLLAVVVVSLGYLFQSQSTGPDEFLFGGAYLPDGQLNEIETALGQARLSNFRREGNRLLIPSGKKADYLAAVADAGALPPDFSTYLDRAIDQGSPWESSSATRMRMQVAKQGMLSDIIRAMDWVEDAVVIYDEQEPAGLNRSRKVTASVNVKPVLGESLTTRRASVLQELVSHALAGMKAEEVHVTSLSGTTAGGDGEIFPKDFNTEYYQARVAYEQYKKQQIRNALHYIPGVLVEVSAELDDTVEQSVRNVKPDPKPAVQFESITREETEQSTSDGGGRPGVVAQGPGRQGTSEQLSQRNVNRQSSQKTDTQNVVGHEQMTQTRAGYTPKEVWATVTIPRSYLVTVWKQRNPETTDPPTSDDLGIIEEQVTTKVENLVAPLLDRQNKGESQWKQVEVVVLDTITPPEIEPPSMGDRAMAWAGRYWTTLAMLGVAMFSLMVLRSVVRSSPPEGAGAAAMPAPSIAVEEEPREADEGQADSDKPPRQRLRLKKSTSLKDDLAELVKEDPETAASILRSWIGKAA